MTREGKRTLKVNFAIQPGSNEKHDWVKWNDSNVGKLVDWWSNSTNAEYNKRAKCIIDQYGNFNATQIGIKLDGTNTQVWPISLHFKFSLLLTNRIYITLLQNPGWEHSWQRRDQRSLLGLQELCCWEGWARGRSQATRIRLHAWTDVLDQLGSGVVRKVDRRKTQVSGIISHMSQNLLDFLGVFSC